MPEKSAQFDGQKVDLAGKGGAQLCVAKCDCIGLVYYEPYDPRNDTRFLMADRTPAAKSDTQAGDAVISVPQPSGSQVHTCPGSGCVFPGGVFAGQLTVGLSQVQPQGDILGSADSSLSGSSIPGSEALGPVSTGGEGAPSALMAAPMVSAFVDPASPGGGGAALMGPSATEGAPGGPSSAPSPTSGGPGGPPPQPPPPQPPPVMTGVTGIALGSTQPTGMSVLSPIPGAQRSGLREFQGANFIGPQDTVLGAHDSAAQPKLPRTPVLASPMAGDFDLGGSNAGPNAGLYGGSGPALSDGIVPPRWLTEFPSPAAEVTSHRQLQAGWAGTATVMDLGGSESMLGDELSWLDKAPRTKDLIGSTLQSLAGTPTPSLGAWQSRARGLAFGQEPARVMADSIEGIHPFGAPVVGGPSLGGLGGQGLGAGNIGGSLGGKGPGVVERAAAAHIQFDIAWDKGQAAQEKLDAQTKEHTKAESKRTDITKEVVDLKHKIQANEDAITELKKKLGQPGDWEQKNQIEALEKNNKEAKEKLTGLEGETGNGGEQEKAKKEEQAEAQKLKEIENELAAATAEQEYWQKEVERLTEEADDGTSVSARDVQRLIDEAKARAERQREREKQRDKKYNHPEELGKARETRDAARLQRELAADRDQKLRSLRREGDAALNAKAKVASDKAKDAAVKADRAARDAERAAKRGDLASQKQAQERADRERAKAEQLGNDARAAMENAEKAASEKKNKSAARKAEQARIARDPVYREGVAHGKEAEKYKREQAAHEKKSGEYNKKASQEEAAGHPAEAARYRSAAERETAKASEAKEKATREKAKEKELKDKADAKDREKLKKKADQERAAHDPQFRESLQHANEAQKNRDKASKYRATAKHYWDKAKQAHTEGNQAAAEAYMKWAQEAEAAAKAADAKADDEDQKAKEAEAEANETQAEREARLAAEKKKKEENKDAIVPLGTWPNCGPLPTCKDRDPPCPEKYVCNNATCHWEPGDPAEKGKGAGEAPPDSLSGVGGKGPGGGPGGDIGSSPGGAPSDIQAKVAGDAVAGVGPAPAPIVAASTAQNAPPAPPPPPPSPQDGPSKDEKGGQSMEVPPAPKKPVEPVDHPPVMDAPLPAPDSQAGSGARNPEPVAPKPSKAETQVTTVKTPCVKGKPKVPLAVLQEWFRRFGRFQKGGSGVGEGTPQSEGPVPKTEKGRKTAVEFINIAMFATAMNWQNTANAFMHLLDRTGNELIIDPDQLEKDVPWIRKLRERLMRLALAEAVRRAMFMTKECEEFYSGLGGAYIDKDTDSGDWYYSGLAGFNYMYYARLTHEFKGKDVLPTYRLCVYFMVVDRFNFDPLKEATKDIEKWGISLGRITVKDSDGVRLVQEGRAMEFWTLGTGSAWCIEWQPGRPPGEDGWKKE